MMLDPKHDATHSDGDTRLVGEGLDSQNLLGFLAALGALVIGQEAFYSSRPSSRLTLGWRTYPWQGPGGSRRGLGERPVWTSDAPLSKEVFLEGLLQGLKSRQSAPELNGMGDDLAVPATVFRDMLLTALEAASPPQRLSIDLACAFGTELYPVLQAGKENIQDTAFRTMSGAGHQHFLKTMRDLIGCVEVSHLNAALFEPWRYTDERLSLRWDSADDRRYALRATNPSSDTPRTQWGANVLAAMGLACFPCAVEGKRLQTSGFEGRKLRWPVWEHGIPLPVVRSLLNHPALWTLESDTLEGLGIQRIFECERLNLDKFRSFSPARVVWQTRSGG